MYSPEPPCVRPVDATIARKLRSWNIACFLLYHSHSKLRIWQHQPDALDDYSGHIFYGCGVDGAVRPHNGVLLLRLNHSHIRSN